VGRWILESLDYKNFGKRGHPLFRGTADYAPASPQLQEKFPRYVG